MQRANVLDIQTPEETSSRSQPEAKWGDAIKAGYQVLPDALIRGQRLLTLSATDLVVIANVNQAWWFADRLPYLQPHTIAKRMGVSERSVQRSLSRLREKGYLQQVRELQKDGTVRYYHDLSGLRTKLEELARRDIRYSEALRRGSVTT
jgi:DNA-binding transcriptional ArsR family regulator